MKVLNICMGAPFTEGYTYQDNLLSECQARLGHQVTVLTSTRTRDANGAITETMPVDKVMDNGVRLVRLKAPGRLRSFLGIYPGVRKCIETIAPDFIFIHGLASFVPRAAIAYKRSHPEVKIVADNHQDPGTTYTDRFPFNLQLRLFQRQWRTWIRHVERIYGTTSWRRTFARDFYGIPEDKLDTLIMGIDSENLPTNPASVRADVRVEQRIPQNAFLFVSGGKMDRNKHVIEAMKAFSALPHANARLLLFGSVLPDIKEEFEGLLAADKRMGYIGYLKSHDIHRYFIAADFGVFPGRHSVLWEEAIGCGLPCLFRRYGECDHTNPCGNAICIPSPDVQNIKETMEAVASGGKYLEELKRGAVKAAPMFSYSTIAEKSLEAAKACHE